MKSTRYSGWLVTLLLIAAGRAEIAIGSPVTDRVQNALSAMHDWVGDGENGNRWRKYLRSQQLATELEKGGKADLGVLGDVLTRYDSGAKGLNLPTFVAVRTAVEAWRAEIVAAADDPLIDQIRSEKGNFVPASPDRLAAARNQLVERLALLDQYLTPGGENGANWKKYLKSEDLSAELRKPDEDVDIPSLAPVYARFRKDHVGLEMPVFADVRGALKNYIDVLNLSRLDDGSEKYAAQVDRLADYVAQYIADPDALTAWRIGRRLDFIEIAGRSRQVLSAIRGRLSRRNLYVGIGTPLINANSARPVFETENVADCILGTSMSGTATSHGTMHVESVPSAGRAHLRLVVSGTICTDTIGENGPVCIYTQGAAPFCMTKDVFLNETALVVRPAVASARVHSQINDIVSKRNFGSRLILRIANRRAAQQKPLAEAIAARRVEQRITARFDEKFTEQATPQIADARTNFTTNIRDPLARFGEKFEQIEFGSSGQSLDISLILANRSQLGAPSSPPGIGTHDLTVRVHESFPNNLAASLIGGFKMTDEWLREKAIELKGELPPELQEGPDEPWSITFDRARPVTAQFAGNGFTVTIRGHRFTSGERSFKAMNITARYKFDYRPEGVVLVRQDNVEIFPPGFDKATDTLSTQQTALVEILNKRFDKVFKPEIPAEGLELPGKLNQLGKLVVQEVSTKDGWLAAGWRLPTRTAGNTVVSQEVAVR